MKVNFSGKRGLHDGKQVPISSRRGNYQPSFQHDRCWRYRVKTKQNEFVRLVNVSDLPGHPPILASLSFWREEMLHTFDCSVMHNARFPQRKAGLRNYAKK